MVVSIGIQCIYLKPVHLSPSHSSVWPDPFYTPDLFSLRRVHILDLDYAEKAGEKALDPTITDWYMQEAPPQ